MAIQIKGIDLVVLLVSDVRCAVAFYCEVLGCTRDCERTDLGLYHLRAWSVFIDLVDSKGKLGLSGAFQGSMKVLIQIILPLRLSHLMRPR